METNKAEHAAVAEFKRVLAQGRRKAKQAHVRQIKKIQQHRRDVERASARKAGKRDLSQIIFDEPSWWWQQPKYGAFIREMTLDQRKAAIIYEATRRRKEVQQAWLEHKDAGGVLIPGWQPFVGFVVAHLPKCWPELDDITRQTLVEEIRSPFFLPPLGYSTFPEDDVAAQKEAACRVIRVSEENNPADLKAFVELLRRYQNAGFVLAVVDNKTRQSVRWAGKAIEELPRSFRAADLTTRRTGHLPQSVPDDVRQQLEIKRKQGTLTEAEVLEAAAEYGSADEGWEVLVSSAATPVEKRKRQGRVIEGQKFHFHQLCHDLEQTDQGLVRTKNIVDRVRLGYL